MNAVLAFSTIFPDVRSTITCLTSSPTASIACINNCVGTGKRGMGCHRDGGDCKPLSLVRPLPARVMALVCLLAEMVVVFCARSSPTRVNSQVREGRQRSQLRLSTVETLAAGETKPSEFSYYVSVCRGGGESCLHRDVRSSRMESHRPSRQANMMKKAR